MNRIKLLPLELLDFRAFAFLFFLSFNLLISSPSFAQEIAVKNIEFDSQNFDKSGEMELKIKISKKTNFKIYILKNPHRLVIDMENAKLDDENYQPKLAFFCKNFSANITDIFLRLEFFLQNKIKIVSSSFDEKNQIITAKINVSHADLSAFIDKISIDDNIIESSNIDKKNIKNSLPNDQTKPNDFPKKPELIDHSNSKIIANKSPTIENKNEDSIKKSNKIPVIVIDAGHGGKDPGTIGNYLRSKEKHVTLSFARELYKQLKSTKSYKVYLTRNSDIFINLKKRVELARRKNADLFISLHVNAIGDDDITGFSIYTLSEQSSDKQAELLAKKENQADIINGVNFSGASIDIMKTLIDLSQRNSKNHSAIFANKVIKNVKDSNIEILQNTHRFAGFAVLTAPDMASVLVELGYLSNADEEKLLNSISYKRKVCESLVKAVEEYFSKIKT